MLYKGPWEHCINITTEDPITEYTDNRQLVSSQQFMGIIKKEYQHHVHRRTETQDPNGHNAYYSAQSGDNNPKGKYCNHCRKDNHITDNCCWLQAPKCGYCEKFGRESANVRATVDHLRPSMSGGWRGLAGDPKLNIFWNRHNTWSLT